MSGILFGFVMGGVVGAGVSYAVKSKDDTSPKGGAKPKARTSRKRNNAPASSAKPRRSFYDVLGVPRTASASDIRRAYRKLAMKHHPNKGGDTEKMQEVNEAYNVLRNANKRRKYNEGL